jgi:hypothetical protein
MVIASYFRVIEKEETIFLTEINGQIVKGGKEVLEKARDAGFGRVYEINYIKLPGAGAELILTEHSQKLSSEYPWSIDMMKLPSYVTDGIAELISKHRKK